MARTAVTPAMLAKAEQQARQSLTAVYAPQPVRQPDGSVLMLCGQSRLDRAMMKAAQARSSGNTALADKMDMAIDQLRDQFLQSQAAAEQAASNWVAMAVAAGVSVEPLTIYPEQCTCVGCTEHRQRRALNVAEAVLRDSIAKLVTQDDAGALPPLCELISQAEDPAVRDRLWWQLKSIADAMQTVASAAQACGERFDFSYRKVLQGVLG